MAFVAACLLLFFALADPLRGGPNPGMTLAARLTWAAALFVAARLLTGRHQRWTEPLVTACFVVSVLSLAALNVIAGDHTASRAFLVVAPLVFAAVLPDALRALVFASIATVICAVGGQLLVGAPPVSAAMDGFRALAAGVLAVLGAISTRKIRDAEVALAEDRARAIEALAVSEKRQAEVEKLAAAGSKAAGVAHDMSNPLASMRCNLDWLREAIEGGQLETDKAEVVEVIKETRECLDRLGQNLQDLRTVARTARALALKVDELAGTGSPVRPVPDRASGE